MATFVVLFDWTDQGIKGFKDSPARVDAATSELAKLGVTLRELFWTIGVHDLVGIADAPDPESLTAALLALGAAGNVRTTTLRAFDRDEFAGIVGRLG